MPAGVRTASELRCDNGTTPHMTFAPDCLDGLTIGRTATTGAYSDNVARGVMLAAVEQRFASQAAQPIE